MRRVFRLTESFFASRRRLVTPRTLPAAALGGTLTRISAGPLPGPFDFEALAYPLGVAWVRRVPGVALWVFFRFDAESVTVEMVTDREPVRVD